MTRRPIPCDLLQLLPLASLLLYYGGLFLIHCQRHYHWQPLAKWMPEWVFWTLFYGGSIVAVAGPSLLGLLGYLPGTSSRRDLPRPGFPIQPHLSGSSPQ